MSRGPGSFRPVTTRSLTIRTPVDELLIRYFVRNEAGAQDELTRLLTERRKRKS